MKKTYMVIAFVLTFFIISSTYSFAAPSFTNDDQSDSSGSDSSLSGDSGGSSDPQDSGPSLTTDSSGLNNDIELLSNLVNNKQNSTIVEIVSISPNPAEIHELITFIGKVSNVENESVVLTWDFGDFSEFRGENVTHYYSAEGTYNVKLTAVINNSTYTDNATVKILLSNSSVDIGGPYLGKIWEPIWFMDYNNVDLSVDRFSILSTSITSDFVSYKWNFGDGSIGYGERVSHTYTEVGIYTVKLIATDKNGDTSTDSTIVTISKLTISIHPFNPVVNDEVKFNVDVKGFTPSKYSWRFGDSFSGSGQSVVHTYSNAGTYYGRLYVYDSSQNFHNSRDSNIYKDFIITVGPNINQDNIKPISFFTVSSDEGDTSTAFKFDASSSFDSDGEIVQYEWCFGDGNMIITKNEKCNYIFQEEGEWEVTCSVIDNKGNHDSRSKKIKVTYSENSPLDTALEITQNDVIFVSGFLKDIEKEQEIYVEPEIDYPDLVELYGLDKESNLELSACIIPESHNVNEPGKIHVIVNDQLGTYDEDTVIIKLTSNIPGYESLDYSVQRDNNTNEYIIDIDISSWSNDLKTYTVNLKATPLNEYTETDWSSNIWSDTIISTDSAESNDIVSDFALLDYNFGSYSL
jgi:PKD repeat protein